jgi:hypothetical protein
VRLTEFRELLYTEFGTVRGDSLLTDLQLTDFGMTGAQAIEAGIDPRDVWRVLCRDTDVPRERW